MWKKENKGNREKKKIKNKIKKLVTILYKVRR